VHLVRLALTDFRSYESADVALRPGVTTFTGPNGSGKTNLIEAAWYLATFSSHRVAADGALVRAGAPRAILRATLSEAGSPGREQTLEVELNPGRANRVRLNRAPLTRPRDAVGVLRCVLFAPEDLAIVKGDPERRRRYLDDLLVVARPRYAGVRADYERVLRQRTALLKSARASAGAVTGLDVWDEQLVTTGAELIAGRLRLLAALRPRIAASYEAVGGGGATSAGGGAATSAGGGGTSIAGGAAAAAAVAYRHGSERSGQIDPDPDQAKLAQTMRESIDRLRRAELDRGACLVGPHRDEIELRIGDLPARGYASHGESWSLALALRLAAFDFLGEDGEAPVLLLDDVFAELDSGRRERLAELVGPAEQVLVTAAVAADIPARLTGERYTVTDGVIAFDR
jgi:DNA replication and repair protein RecF